MNLKYIKTALFVGLLGFSAQTQSIPTAQTVAFEAAAALPALGALAPYLTLQAVVDLKGTDPVSPALEQRLAKIFKSVGIDMTDLDIKQYGPAFAQQVEGMYLMIQNHPAITAQQKEVFALQLFVTISGKTLFVNEQRCVTLTDDKLKEFVLSQVAPLINNTHEKQLALSLGIVATNIVASSLLAKGLIILAEKYPAVQLVTVLKDFANSSGLPQSVIKTFVKFVINAQLIIKANQILTRQNQAYMQELLAR